MKTKIIYIAFCVLFTLAACGKLEEDVYDFVSPANFYKTAAEAEAALLAVYDQLQRDEMWNRGVYLIGDMSSDDTFTGGFKGNASRVQIDEFSIDANNAVATDRFELSYDLINRANTVIDRVPNIQMNEEQKANIINQARFLRAFTYFYLVQLYGDVPLKITATTQLEDVGSPRVSTEKIYQEVIIPDLVAAEALPVTQNQRGRITKGAAKALSAKVYLTRKEWEKARDKAKEVIDLGVYSLWDRYIDAFKVANEANGKEDIFSVQFKNLLGEGGNIQSFFQPRGVSGAATNGNGVNEPTFDIVNDYEPGDERFLDTYLLELLLSDGTIKEYDPYKNPYIAKYFESTAPIGNVNYPVLRYSDVLLMYAEAVNEISGPTVEAYEAINLVRNRAGLPNIQDKPGYVESQENFRTELQHERRIELAFEGHRRFDLVRWGIFIPTMKAHAEKWYPTWAPNINDKFILFPIPQREIDLNPAIEAKDQNPGY